MLTSGASAGTLFFYGQNLPSLKSFQGRMQFQNTVIVDRFGRKLFDLADLSNKNRGRRVIEKLQWPGNTDAGFAAHGQDWLTDSARHHHGIPLVFQNATIATEDASFYSNPGFDPFSIARAAYDNWVKNEVVSGASTITQQLVRRYMHLTGATLSRKTEEVVLAAELTQKYPKSKILWYYLNSISYGNLSIGAEAASETYFHKHAYNLDLAKSALLAGLPEAPSIYNPVTDKPSALRRMHYVLYLMCLHGYLHTSQCSNPDPPIIRQQMAEAQKWVFKPPAVHTRYPHFVQYVIDQLQNLSQTVPSLKNKIYNGLRVETTLDPRLQNAAQGIVSGQINQLGAYNVTDGALVSIDVQKDCLGCIRAMVGSADYNARYGQINMAISPRQPGSSFKPFNYIYGFQHQLSPATTVIDGPIAIPDQGNPDDGGWYEPLDYDKLWHGAVTLRTALDNSLNIPAIKVEQYNAQVPGNAEGLLAIRDQAVKMGLTSFKQDNPHCCGWALTLGGVERGVRLVEQTAAYGVFANNGSTVPPTSIRRVYDRTTGALLYDSQKPAQSKYVFDPAYAYEMNNVLSDNNARCQAICEFGLDSPLYLGRPAAAKTGTTTGFTDNWTMGYTPDIVTGVWVGNADNSPMVGTTGVTGAAPIWHDFMLKALDILRLPPKDFGPPPASVYSGTQCLLPGDAYSPSSMGYDIYVGQIPYCSVGTSSTFVPVPQPGYTPPVLAPVVPAPSPSAATPVATAPPAAAPTAPASAANGESVPGAQSGGPPATLPPPAQVLQPTAPPVVQSPPAQSPPAASANRPGCRRSARPADPVRDELQPVREAFRQHVR